MVDEFLGGLPPLLVYAVVALLVAAESAFVAGLVLPAATALIAMGLLANAGVVAVVPAILVGALAAVLGGSLAYASGKRTGPKLRARRPERWERADRLFQRYGGRAVFLGQWLVGARTLVPRLAGLNGMPYRRFAMRQMPSGVLWSLWMVGASYLAGASYHVLAARVGQAGGALAVFAAMVVGLVLAGRWFGRHPGRWSRLGSSVVLSLGALTVLAIVLVLVVPLVVRFSGLASADAAVAFWARGQWTSDGYLFALDAATTIEWPQLLFVAALVSLGSWWAARRRGRRDAAGMLLALGPVVPLAVLVLAVNWKGWSPPEVVFFPPVTEFDGPLPVAAGARLAQLAGGSVAPLAAACGLLAWLIGRHLPRSLRTVVWAAAVTLATVSAGSWVYLGWSRLSETIAALLLGAAWAALNAAIWSGRLDREDPAGPAVAALVRRARGWIAQLAVQERVGALLVPFHEPRKPKVAVAPAERRPL
ncbi:DedA family protein [Actinoplanes sp. TBRC 11911]|uniref:DedA family protein n=1 Tax=Actinoplanes sp. TBRC 11911 TaxID=2729386 RepID=UPI00145E9F10|nr:DedA family protein [Actinoplanes sp. TBRC 11911]NMO54879.1 DedA family protein [Actinoplanes sp. TBRC 11911]